MAYQRWWKTVRDQQGNAINGATCTVYNGGLGTLAAVYDPNSDDAHPSTLANPFITTANGIFGFMAEDGCYDVEISGGSLATQQHRVVLNGANFSTHLASPSGSEAIGYQAPFNGSTPTTQNLVNSRNLHADDTAAIGDGVHDDTDAINAGIDAAAGGVFTLGNKSYAVSGLLVSNPNTHIQFSHNTTLVNLNANATMLTFAADGCSIDGAHSGKITSPASWDGTNSPATYAIIVANGNKTKISNLEFINIKRVGVWFKDGDEQILEGCRFEGNYPSESWTGAETVHFGCFFDPAVGSGGNPKIFRATNNTFRSCVQGIFVGNYGLGSDINMGGILIAGNNFEGCWNHGIYMASSFGATISSNNFLNCQVGIVAEGKYHSVCGNTLTTNGTGALNNVAGISMREPVGCVVSGNTVYGDASAGSTVISLVNLVGDFLTANTISDNIVSNNVVIVEGGTSNAIGVGGSLTEVMNNNIISNNRVICVGRTGGGEISFSMKTGFYGYGNMVNNNNITVKGNASGVVFNNQKSGRVSANSIHFETDLASPSTIGGIQFVNTSSSRFDGNDIICTSAWGANATIRAICELTGCDFNLIDGNRISLDTTKLSAATPIFRVGGANDTVRDNLATGDAYRVSGVATIASGSSSIVVANTNITDDSFVAITPSDAGGGKLFAATGVYATQTPGVGFSILTADGTNAPQSSSFRWVIK